MSTIEKKTMKGNVIKVIENKWIFVAFTTDGYPVTYDDNSKNLYHPIPMILFFGEDFHVKNNYNLALSFLRIKDGKLIIPYEHSRKKGTQHLLIGNDIEIDMMPVRLTSTQDFGAYITTVVKGSAPDYIIVDNKITKNDVTILKNRCATAKILKVGDDIPQNDPLSHSFDEMGPFAQKRAADLLSDFNINEISENPVFLARVHLRRMDFTRTKQLLLDFNLSELDIRYILTFLETIEKNIDEEELIRYQKQLEYLNNSFQFYRQLLNKDKARICTMIENTKDNNELTTFRTLISKIKQTASDNEDQLSFIEYENLIYEMEEALKDD